MHKKRDLFFPAKNKPVEVFLHYEEYIEKSGLINDIYELERIQELGCWCHPNMCHGDILIKKYNEFKSKK